MWLPGARFVTACLLWTFSTAAAITALIGHVELKSDLDIPASANIAAYLSPTVPAIWVVEFLASLRYWYIARTATRRSSERS